MNESSDLTSLLSSLFNQQKKFCNREMVIATMSDNIYRTVFLTCKEKNSINLSTRWPELCSHSEISFSQIALAMSRVDVSFTLASYMHPTNNNCAIASFL